MVRPRGQNVTGNVGETSPAGCTHGKAAQRSNKDQVKWVHLRPSLGVEPAGLSEVIENREAFRVLQGLFPSRPPRRKAGVETNEWVTKQGKLFVFKLLCT